MANTIWKTGHTKLIVDEKQPIEPAGQRQSEAREMCQEAQRGNNEVKNTSEVIDTPLSAQIQGEIGRQLRQVYGRMLAEPLPEKFKELLDRLAKSEPKS